jgi:hypothetical protein
MIKIVVNVHDTREKLLQYQCWTSNSGSSEPVARAGATSCYCSGSTKILRIQLRLRNTANNTHHGTIDHVKETIRKLELGAVAHNQSL